MEVVDEFLTKIEEIPQDVKSKYCKYGGAGCMGMFFLLLIIFCAGLNREATMEKRPVVITTDLLPDDLSAIEYLFRRSDLSVKAIIANVNGYTSTVEAQLDVLRTFLALLINQGCEDCKYVEIARGSLKPLADNNRGDSKSSTSSCAFNQIVPEPLRTLADSGFSTRSTAHFFNVRQSLAFAVGETDAKKAEELRAQYAFLSSKTEPSTVNAICSKFNTNSDVEPTSGKVNPDSIEFVSLGPMTDVVLCAKAAGIESIKAVFATGGVFTTKSTLNNFFPDGSGRSEANVFFDPAAASALLTPAGASASIKVAKDGAVLVAEDAGIVVDVDDAASSSAYKRFAVPFETSQATDLEEQDLKVRRRYTSIYAANAAKKYSQELPQLGKVYGGGSSSANISPRFTDLLTVVSTVDMDSLRKSVDPVVKDVVSIKTSSDLPLREVGTLGAAPEKNADSAGAIQIVLGDRSKNVEEFIKTFDRTMKLGFPNR